MPVRESVLEQCPRILRVAALCWRQLQMFFKSRQYSDDFQPNSTIVSDHPPMTREV